jgi:hypothetical protein
MHLTHARPQTFNTQPPTTSMLARVRACVRLLTCRNPKPETRNPKPETQAANIGLPETQINAILRVIERDATGKLDVKTFLDRFQVSYIAI